MIFNNALKPKLAVGEGFEPSLGLYTLNRFSKPAPSAARPPHRMHDAIWGYVRGSYSPVNKR